MQDNDRTRLSDGSSHCLVNASIRFCSVREQQVSRLNENEYLIRMSGRGEILGGEGGVSFFIAELWRTGRTFCSPRSQKSDVAAVAVPRTYKTRPGYERCKSTSFRLSGRFIMQ